MLIKAPISGLFFFLVATGIYRLFAIAKGLGAMRHTYYKASLGPVIVGYFCPQITSHANVLELNEVLVYIFLEKGKSI